MSGTKRWAAGLFIALIFMYNHVGALAQGETSAKAACVLEMETGRVLFEQNARARLPMASTTKVMTALLAIENGDLSAPVTCSANAFGVPGTSIYLAEGETLTLEQMLYDLMLASGNDAAVAIAEHIGGSVPQFVQRMNARAAELGAANTHFANPNGLPDVSEDCLYPAGRNPVGGAVIQPSAQKQKQAAGKLSRRDGREDGLHQPRGALSGFWRESGRDGAGRRGAQLFGLVRRGGAADGRVL